MDKFENITEKIENVQEDEVKLWLFWENVRIKAERSELERSIAEFEEKKAQLEKELNEREQDIALKAKMAANEQELVDKKLNMLKDAYKQLERDRKKIERERNLLESDKRRIAELTPADDSSFFRGVDDIGGLKKRYRDLSRIFHPDNVNGDKETFQMITREFTALSELWQ